MRIWHQSLTVLEDLPDYVARLQHQIKRTVRPETEVVLHGLLPGTYPANYPGDDIGFTFLFAMHSLQFPLQALNAQRLGFDAFAICTLPDPMLRETRTIVDIPVIGCGEICFHEAAMNGRKFGMLVFIDRMAQRYQEQISGYGLADRCVGIEPVGFRFHDVLEAFAQPAHLIDRFRESARAMIARGAMAIIPGEIPLNVLLASEGIHDIDGIPLLDSLGLTLKATEKKVDLSTQPGAILADRSGWADAMPARERVLSVLDFYGLSRFLQS